MICGSAARTHLVVACDNSVAQWMNHCHFNTYFLTFCRLWLFLLLNTCFAHCRIVPGINGRFIPLFVVLQEFTVGLCSIVFAYLFPLYGSTELSFASVINFVELVFL